MARQQKSTLVSDQLRAAILEAEVSRYRIAQETGVNESIISRFVRAERGLDLTSIDRLATYFGLELVATGRQQKGD